MPCFGDGALYQPHSQILSKSTPAKTWGAFRGALIFSHLQGTIAEAEFSIFVPENLITEIIAMKKITVISTSLRQGSNSDMLADSFVEGAKAAGNNVRKISLSGKEIQFCKGCLACQKLGRCVIADDVNAIMAEVIDSEVVVWATPIYYYEMSGQMKTLIDRMNAMYPLDYKFRDVYLLATAAEDEESTPKRAVQGLEGWIECYPESRLAGTIFCGGVNNMREIEGNPKLKAAYDLGHSIR